MPDTLSFEQLEKTFGDSVIMTITTSAHAGFQIMPFKENIDDYNKKVTKFERMPFLIIFCNNLAGLMSDYPKETERFVGAISGEGEGIGIHLVVSTQKQSVDVITGSINACFPVRLCFSVQTKIDSRMIIGESGAEKLQGVGDALLMSRGGRISRIHTLFIKDTF